MGMLDASLQFSYFSGDHRFGGFDQYVRLAYG